MDRRCGQTFEDTLKLFHRYDDPERPMPFMLIATWNDYEEGTQIETGVSDCHKNENRDATSSGDHSGSSGAFVPAPRPTS
jgi:hypothetical protein